MKASGTIRSLPQLLDYLKDNRRFKEFHSVRGLQFDAPAHRWMYGIWFRGHTNAGHRLIPSVFREPIDEASSIFHFMLRNPRFRSTCTSMFDWLCVMRHYTLPCRVLDWTENALIGLFFACKDSKEHNKKPGALWVLNSRKLNSRTRVIPPHRGAICIPEVPDVILRAALAVAVRRDEFEQVMKEPIDPVDQVERNLRLDQWRQQSPKQRIEQLRTPVAVFPYRTEPRMTLQQSVFTIHGGKMEIGGHGRNPRPFPAPIGLEQLAEKAPAHERFLIKLDVPADSKERLRRELRTLGIHEAALFPEPEYEASFIRSNWRTDGEVY